MKMESQIIVRLPLELREALEQAAHADQRTPSNYIRKLLADHLAKRGFLKSGEGRKGKGE